MKEQTKRKLLLVAVVAMTICAFAFALTACNPPAEGEKTVNVYIGEQRYSVTTEGLYLFDALKKLSENEGIALDYSGSKYGAYITAVGELKPDTAAREYITVYHDIDDDGLKGFGVADVELTHDGKIFYYSGVGVSLLPLEDGASYWLFVTTY